MKACLTCQRSSAVGGGYSNRIRATKFNPTGKVRRYPNLQWTRTGEGKRVRLCAKCIKAGKQLKFAA